MWSHQPIETKEEVEVIGQPPVVVLAPVTFFCRFTSFIRSNDAVAVCLRGLFSLQLIHHLLEKDVVVVLLVIRVAGFKRTMHYPEQSGISVAFAQHNHM